MSPTAENDFRIVAAGDSAVVVEFQERIDPAVNARVVALAESIQAAAPGGIRDVVPTYRSLAIFFDPLRTDFDGLLNRLEREGARPPSAAPAPPVPLRIPVCYGGRFGPDLSEVAAFAGLSEAEVIVRHQAPTYRVFMLGFMPGFPYLGSVDPRIAAPRRAAPRTRVPAGSVGIAGFQTGIYSADTPGGWQIVGRTPVKPFDLLRPEPFLLKPGDAVQFYSIDEREYDQLAGVEDRQPAVADRPTVTSPRDNRFVHVIRPGLLTTVQDLGRWGFQARGVPVAGPMDPCSHRIANALVGNNPGAATLEVTLVGPEIEFEDNRLVAVAGAEFALSVDGCSQPVNAAFGVTAGSRLKFGGRRRGTRAYLAIAGGIAVPPTLGSRATHLPSRMGGLDGRLLAAGDRVPLGAAPFSSRPKLRLVDELGRLTAQGALASPPMPDQAARVRVLPGPQYDRFAADALDQLQSAPYSIGADSNRMGYRLDGPALGHLGGADIISDATPIGVLQVPASGRPLLLMADRQATGGYPKLATVITADIGIAGQLAPGDRLVFDVCRPDEALAALIARERALMAIETMAQS